MTYKFDSKSYNRKLCLGRQVVYPRLIVFEAINRPTIGKDTRTMSKDNVVELKKPDVFLNDSITESIRALRHQNRFQLDHFTALSAQNQKHGAPDSLAVSERCFHG